MSYGFVLAGDINIFDPVNIGLEVYDKEILDVERGVTKSIEKIIQYNKGIIKIL